MARDDDFRPEGRFVDGQVAMMDQDTEAGDDLQRCQRQRIVVVAVTRDRVARSKLGELRYDQRPADVAGVEDYVAPFEREDGLGAQRPCVSEMTPISNDGSTVRAGDGACRPGSAAGP